MKILIFAHHAEGLYLPRKELIMQLKKVGHEVIVSIPKGRCYEKIEALVDKVIDTPVERRGMNPIKDGKLLWFYAQIINKYRPDCILSYAIKPNLYGGIVGRFYHVPYIMNITGLGTAFSRENIICKVATALYKLVAGHERCVFFQNKGNQLILEQHNINWRNPVLIPGSGVNLDAYSYEVYPDDDGVIRFLFVSRILREKGIYELAEASKKIKKKYSNIEFHVLGKCEDGYEAVMKKWHDDGIFIYHGHQSDVKKFIKEANALVHPSYYPEGMSNVCLEAAATGRPVLTTSDIYGCKETVDDGITGYKFLSRNVPSLCSALEAFINLPNTQKIIMGQKAREKMERQFDRQIVIDAYFSELVKIKVEGVGR